LQSSLYQTPTASTADDILKVKDTSFGNLDAGSGFDRLVFLQDGNIDLSNLSSANSLSNLELIDSSNGVSNAITMDADLIDQINADNTLYVLGDSTDSLDLSGWTAGASTTIDTDLTWNSYTSTASNGQAVTIYADSQINTTT